MIAHLFTAEARLSVFLFQALCWKKVTQIIDSRHGFDKRAKIYIYIFYILFNLRKVSFPYTKITHGADFIRLFPRASRPKNYIRTQLRPGEGEDSGYKTSFNFIGESSSNLKFTDIIFLVFVIQYLYK